MRRHNLLTTVLFIAVSLISVARAADKPPVVHAVIDLSHSFTFYFDGRWTRQYVRPIGGKGANSFSTLSKYKFDNANLLVLQSGATPCPYPESDIEKVREFLDSGGGVIMLGDLDDVQSGTAAKDHSGAWEIRSFAKAGNLRNSRYLRTVFV